MNKKFLIIIAIFSLFLQSCITTKEVRYKQPSESLVINEEGLVPYSTTEYRIRKDDVLILNIVTTPKGDATQFYSNLNASENGLHVSSRSGGEQGAGPYFSGLRVDARGDINVFGMGYIKAEGRTLDDVAAEIQSRVNENFVEGKSEVRLTLDGIHYYVLGDIETTGMTGEKVAYKQNINIMEALAQNGGLNRSIDRKNVTLERKFPEGTKSVNLDLTREDIANSPYYWLQNGDLIYLKTRPKSFYGFGKDPLSTLTTGVTILTTVLSIYVIFTKF